MYNVSKSIAFYTRIPFGCFLGKKRSFFPLVLAVFAVTGCNAMKDAYTVDPAFYAAGEKKRKGLFQKQLIAPLLIDETSDGKSKNKYKKIHAEAMDFGASSTTSLRNWAIGFGGAINASERKTRRNRLQDLIINRSEQLCSRHKASILAYNAGANTALSLIIEGLAAAGAVSSGGIARIAGIVIGGIAGVRSSVKSELLQKRLATAIVGNIQSRRRDFRSALNEKRKKTAVEYSVDAAIRDARSYHNLCSLMNGITTVDAETSGDDAPEQIKKINQKISDLDSVIKKLKTEKLKLPRGDKRIYELNQRIGQATKDKKRYAVAVDVLSRLKSSEN